MINKLRGYFATYKSKSFVITGAPQCPLSDTYFQMKDMIAGAQFDILWIQFYNNPSCDALNGGFNFDAWVQFLVGTLSAHATLFIGLPGSTAAAGSGFVAESQLAALLTKYGTRPAFGGVMLWDSYLAGTNKDAKGTNYINAVKKVLATVTAVSTPKTTSHPTTTACSNVYTVKTGDYCYEIAQSYSITVAQIMSLNPSLNSYCDIKAGQKICLPKGAKTKRTVAAVQTPAPTSFAHVYRARATGFATSTKYTALPTVTAR